MNDEKKIQLLLEAIYELTVDPENYTKTEIAKKVNRSPNFIYLKWEELCNICTCGHGRIAHKEMCHYATTDGQCGCKLFDGKLNKSSSGHVIRAKSNRAVQSFDDIKKTNFVKLVSVKKWIDSMRRNNQVKNWKFMVTNFWRICTTIDVHPDIFLQEIETAEDMKEKFVMMLRDGKAVYIYNVKKIDPEKQSKVNPQSYIEAIRSFRERNNKELPKGYLMIERMGVDVYARVHLDDLERKLAITFFKKLFPALLGLFVIQHEIGVRINTLFTIKPIFVKEITKIDDQECVYWKAIIPEEKQNRNFDKFIWTPEGMDVVSKLESGKRIHSFTNIREGKSQYNKALRLVYAMLGKISDERKKQEAYVKGTEEYYMVNDPSHAIRHSSVHKLMRMTGERAEDVATMFWDTPETLKIYKKNNIDSILKQGLCMICNPPPESEKKYERFCTLRHSVLYYNGYRAE